MIEAGLVPYDEALEWQRSLAAARIDGRLARDVILLLEHPPVVTLGRNARAGHVLGPCDLPVVEVERGGDVTFHGPGQLVGYPILDLGGYRRDLHWYLRTLEQALIDALAQLDIPAERRPGYTGVWTSGGGRKIASIGVHVKQWVTWHGFALNVTTDLSHFEHRAVRDSGGRHDVDTTGNAKAERGKGSVGANGAGGDSRVYKGLRRHHNPFTGRHPPPLAEHRLTRIPECIDLVLRQPATAVPLLRPRVAPHVIAVLLPESRQVFLE